MFVNRHAFNQFWYKFIESIDASKCGILLELLRSITVCTIK